jgi:hypothetical protein
MRMGGVVEERMEGVVVVVVVREDLLYLGREWDLGEEE